MEAFPVSVPEEESHWAPPGWILLPRRCGPPKTEQCCGSSFRLGLCHHAEYCEEKKMETALSLWPSLLGEAVQALWDRQDPVAPTLLAGLRKPAWPLFGRRLCSFPPCIRDGPAPRKLVNVLTSGTNPHVESYVIH